MIRMTDPPPTAADRWAAGLDALAIPQHILDAAPTSPWGFDPATFGALADLAVARVEDSPSDAAARSALPSGGTVLDVGAGAGAAALRLHDRAGLLVAFDPSRPLLAAFSERAERLGIDHDVIVGSWPHDAEAAPVADVVTCHHVTYNVPDLGPFAVALDAHATSAVVVEMTVEHPLTWMAPLWKEVHGLDRPAAPTVDDALAVLAALGFHVAQTRWRRAYAVLGEHEQDEVAKLARRLCVGPDRHDEIAALLDIHRPPAEREVVTLSWAPTGRR
jgi:SAM-dependent methyltransferase